MLKRALGVFALFFMLSIDLLAIKVQRPFYTLREKGQGGAIVSASTDYSAVMLNPANMADMQEGNLNMGFGGAYTSAFFDFQDDFTDFAGEEDAATKLNKYNALIANYSGENFSLNPNFYGMYSGTKWGFGFVPINTEFNISVSEDRFNVDSYLDGLLLFGTGRKINDKWAWGATLKSVYRGYFALEVTSTDLATVDEDSLFDSGSAIFGLTFDMDVAANYKAPTWKGIDPKFSFVLRNLFDYGFTHAQSGVGEAPKLQRSLDLGSQFTFKKFWVFTPALMFDIRDIGISDWDFQTGYHIGAELQWHAYSWLKGAYRIGLNQGYFTAGINMQMSWFRLDIATWGEEVGTADERSESRLVGVNLALDF